MLNFTYSSEDASGQFNGRFVFRAPIRSGALTREHLKAIANATDEALTDEALRHEYLHWKVFQHSTVGISLVGKRYRVRPLFLKGFHSAVRRYYAQRSAFFLSVYDTHEAIVKELDESTGPTTREVRSVGLSPEQIDRVRAADSQSLIACTQMGAPLQSIEVKADSYLGRLATREFGVQAYLPTNDGNPPTRLYEVALKGASFGIVNSGTETEFSTNPPLHIRTIRKIISLGNSERWFGALDKNKLARWAYLKFNTELPLLESRWNHSSIRPEAYVQTMVRFITRYLGRAPSAAESSVVDLLRACATHPEDSTISRLQLLDEDFLYFFYAHGN